MPVFHFNLGMLPSSMFSLWLAELKFPSTTGPTNYKKSFNLVDMDHWNEKLRCPRCGKTGIASMSQHDDSTIPIVQSVSDGFKVIARRYVPDFECGTCNVVVMP